jgi:hypothetical protein
MRETVGPAPVPRNFLALRNGEKKQSRSKL